MFEWNGWREVVAPTPVRTRASGLTNGRHPYKSPSVDFLFRDRIPLDARVSTPVPRLRGRRPKSRPAGRQALVDAAVKSFGRMGYDGADLRGIARAAHVDPALVRVHFGSKAGLWVACLDAIVEAARPMIEEGRRLNGSDLPLIDRLRRFIEHLGVYVLSHPECRDFVTMHMSECDARAETVSTRLVRPAFEAVRPLIEAGIASGHVRVRHPALFYGLLHHALNRPRAVAVILNKLAPDIAPADVDRLLVDSLITAFLDPCPPPAASTAGQRNPTTSRASLT